MPSTDPAAILTRAADVIETRGLTRGSYVDHQTGQVCALAAIAVACGLSAEHWQTEKVAGNGPLMNAAEALARDVRPDLEEPRPLDVVTIASAIASWSDNCDHATVAAGLRSCAEGLARGAA